MRLFVQVPCLNEEQTIGEVIGAIPRNISGIDEVKVMVIDDGCTDSTVEVARNAGADYVIHLPYTFGLARAFAEGIKRCLELGADIIVNTDADRQYDSSEIPRLLQPIIDGQADIVIGDRQTATLPHFSYLKRILQHLGSKTVSFLAGVKVPDATSGFRAYSREAALRLNVFSKFTYTLETIIQAGANHMAVTHVPVQANGPTRNSRLFKNLSTYLKRSVATILRIYTLYEPLRTLFYLGGVILLIGVVGFGRFTFYWYIGDGGHTQSLIVSAVCVLMGFQIWILAVIADLISVNRHLSEEILYRSKRRDILSEETKSSPSENRAEGRGRFLGTPSQGNVNRAKVAG